MQGHCSVNVGVKRWECIFSCATALPRQLRGKACVELKSGHKSLQSLLGVLHRYAFLDDTTFGDRDRCVVCSMPYRTIL